MGRAHADSRTLDQSAESLGQRGVAVFILGGAGTKAIRYQNNMLFTHATGYVKRMLYDHIFWGIFFFFSEQWVFTDLNTLDFTTCKVPNKATENQIHKQLWRFQIPFHPCSVQRLDGIHSERRKAQLPPLSQNDCVEEIGGSKMKPQSRWGMQRAMSNLGRAVSWMRGKRAPEDAMGWAGREVFDSPWEWVLEWEKVIGDLWPSGRVSKGCNRIKEAREGLGAKWAADAPCPHGTATAQLQLPVLHARCGQVFYGFRRDWQSRFSCENQG